MYSVVSYEVGEWQGVLMIWSLVLIQCLGVFFGAGTEKHGLEIARRSILGMVVLFLLLIPIAGVYTFVQGKPMDIGEQPLIGLPYFAALGMVELMGWLQKDEQKENTAVID